MENFILGIFEGSVTFPFDGAMSILVTLFIIFWGIVLGWVWLDSSSRTSNQYLRIFSVFLVLFLNILGLIIYLIMRPSQTIEEIYWADLERRYLKYETAELGDCPKCAYQLQPGFVHCPSCEYELKVKCDKCDVWIDKDWNSCAYCGTENSEKRKRKDKEEVSVEEMAEQIKASKEEAVETVESKKTRYAVRTGIVEYIFSSVRKVISELKKKIVKKKKTKSNIKKKSKKVVKKIKGKRTQKKQ